MSQTQINVVKGEGPDDFDVTTDATSLSTVSCRCIFADGITRDEAARMLDDVRTAILDGRRAWPLAT